MLCVCARVLLRVRAPACVLLRACAVRAQMENMSTLIAIQHRITGEEKDFKLIQPHRRLAREGELQLTEPQKKGFFGTLKTYARCFFLFNDILLWTNKEMEFKSFMNLAATKITVRA